MPVNSHSFFANIACQYYPCHDLEPMNCLFCYCPFYDDLACGGDFNLIKGNNGNVFKDCSCCTYPHEAGNYTEIVRRLSC